MVAALNILASLSLAGRFGSNSVTAIRWGLEHYCELLNIVLEKQNN